MRLIDADALSKDLEKRWNVNDDQDFCNKEVWHALEEAPTIEPDGDLISRQAAIRWVKTECNPYGKPTLDFESGKKVIEHLGQMPSAPSAEAEQVTGKLNNPDDSLLTADSEACKEQKSKLDLISRQDAVSEIHKYFVEEIDKTPTEIDEDGDELYTDMPTVNSLLACNKELSRRIKSLPSAPDSRQRGEWVRKYDGHINCYWYECDQCGEYRPRNQFGHEYNANFCPNCGARMKGGEDE